MSEIRFQKSGFIAKSNDRASLEVKFEAKMKQEHKVSYRCSMLIAIAIAEKIHGLQRIAQKFWTLIKCPSAFDEALLELPLKYPVPCSSDLVRY